METHDILYVLLERLKGDVGKEGTMVMMESGQDARFREGVVRGESNVNTASMILHVGYLTL